MRTVMLTGAAGNLGRAVASAFAETGANLVLLDVKRTKADITRIRAELGWEPRVPLAEGLRAEWEWASGRVGAR